MDPFHQRNTESSILQDLTRKFFSGEGKKGTIEHVSGVIGERISISSLRVPDGMLHPANEDFLEVDYENRCVYVTSFDLMPLAQKLALAYNEKGQNFVVVQNYGRRSKE